MKYLNFDGLTHLVQKLKDIFASKENIENLDAEISAASDQIDSMDKTITEINIKMSEINTDAEKNKINAICVNGVEQKPDEKSKSVDISIPTGRLSSKDSVGITDFDSELLEILNEKVEFTGLTNIAKTGNINDLIQQEGDLLILNCGSASKNI